MRRKTNSRQTNRHRGTSKHKTGQKQAAENKKTLKQQPLQLVSKDFRELLVKTFLAADIPLDKVRSKHVIHMFEALGHRMPCKTACREQVTSLADNEHDRLRKLLKDKLAFIVIDESEVDKKKFINVLAGDVDALEKTYLVDCSVTETVNQSIICTKLDDCLKKN